MSIKSKLTIGIFTIALIILMINTTMFYSYSKSGLQQHWDDQIRQITIDLADATESMQMSTQQYEEQLGSTMNTALRAVSYALGTTYKGVTADRLNELRSRWQLSSLSLYAVENGALITAVTSDARQWVSPPTLREADGAMISGLLKDRDNPASQSDNNEPFYWHNRFDYSPVESTSLEKQSFLFERTHDYVLGGKVFARDLALGKGLDPKRIIDKMMDSQPDVVDVTIFNPASFLEESTTYSSLRDTTTPYWNRPLLYGGGKFVSLKEDQEMIREALLSDDIVTADYEQDGSHYTKKYYRPYGDISIVVSVTADPSSITNQLRQQLVGHMVAALAILAFVSVAGFVLSGLIIRPLTLILNKVNHIAIGSFGEPIEVARRDEFGLLASHINRMSSNLETYTKRLHQTVEELRSTKEYLESFVGQTSDAIHVVDVNGKLLMVNKAFEALYGWTQAQLEQEALSIIPGAGAEETAKLINKLMLGGQVSGFETTGHKCDGTAIEVSVTVSPIRDGAGNVVAFATITRDITDRRETEELLRRSEKLSIVGQLAAGVAHEIRNPLTTLRGFVQLQQYTMKCDPIHLELMLSELDRINFIVSEFLILAKPQAIHYEMKDPRIILGDILALLESQANMNNVVFRIDFASDVPPIRCEVNQLKQVFVNLLKNAMEAMPEGGPIDILVRPHSPSEVLIRITDSGSGIPEDQLPKLGEPFYTNKEKGTGLGLMVCQQIIDSHKGNMRIHSRVGKGTTVDIVLPVE